MATLKNNINNISDNTETLVKDYVKLFSIKLSEKLALLLGILAAVFILSLLLLIVIAFCSFALAVYLNELLAHDYWGFWIVSAFYVLVITLIIVKIVKTKTPPLSNLFTKFIVSVLGLDMNQAKSIKGLKFESENVKQKIETDKIKIKTDFQLLRYAIMESFLKEIFGLFTSKKKDATADEPEPDQVSDEKDKDE
ncbi:MAG: phage holin family protein [Bacteroidales bacterium]|nr:phage holin family protein [Bacteroidales bacterium]